MPRKYTFRASYSGDRPPDGTASRAAVTITDPDGRTQTLRLTAGELRGLHRAALAGLGYTKVPRTYGQWDTTWQEEIDRVIEPIVAVTKAILPMGTPKAQAS